MGSLDERQQAHFTDRIRRIEAGGPNTSGTIYAGMDETVHRRAKKKRRRSGGLPIMIELLILPFALVMGAGVMLVGRMGAYHAMADPELVPVEKAAMFALTADIGIAVALGTVMVLLFSLGRGLRLVCFMMGFTGVMLAEGTLMAQAPEIFADMFSEEYVAEAVARAPASPFAPQAFGL